ncbi:hypothetical protein ACQKPX_06060 [Photobacterium sp. DNB23_23_1]|uniref:ATPase n=1 Tax=Photobacterium pectinilyticum TaxID=2906793 RepID=A0ABT1MZS5_9GAMM|nr:hypothetical protein [Photobacterium sp. ZSDE20]MCQ1057342.1 hypothetical protein [Photobacterium sp. ZSDE20]MDD1821801.1 hypothetical protein [Photobacterium sp. ZSDE20]
MKYVGKVASMALLAALLAGCASTPDNDNRLSTEVNVESVLQSADKIHRHWRNTLVEAEGLMPYAPERYATMIESWQRADNLFKEIQSSPELANQSYSLFSSMTYLERFYNEIEAVKSNHTELVDLKKIADKVLEPAMTQLAYLNSIDANAHYRSEFVRLNRFYSNLFAFVARGNLNRAREEQTEFLSRAQSLEVRVIKRIYITPQEEALRQLRREDVRYYAPLSYAKVEEEIKAGKDLIDNYPRAFDAINQVVSAIEFELAHATHIAEEVKYLRDRNRDEYEDYILAIEGKLLSISKALNDSDLRDHSLVEQAQRLSTNAADTRKQYELVKRKTQPNQQQLQLDTLKGLIEKQNQQIAKLQAQLLATATVPTVSVPSNEQQATTLQHSDIAEALPTQLNVDKQIVDTDEVENNSSAVSATVNEEGEGEEI